MTCPKSHRQLVCNLDKMLHKDSYLVLSDPAVQLFLLFQWPLKSSPWTGLLLSYLALSFPCPHTSVASRGIILTCQSNHGPPQGQSLCGFHLFSGGLPLPQAASVLSSASAPSPLTLHMYRRLSQATCICTLLRLQDSAHLVPPPGTPLFPFTH